MIIYVNYETNLVFDVNDWKSYYQKEIDHVEYPDFECWWSDMMRSGNLRPVNAKPGDIIFCKGIRITIGEILYQDWHYKDGWIIEFRNNKGEYGMWKQHADGGRLIRVTSK